MRELTEWEAWLCRNDVDGDSTFDKLIELAIHSYKLDTKWRKMEFVDVVQFFIKWWFPIRKKTTKYDTLAKIGEAINRDHAAIIHLLKHRTPTRNYKINTECINDFLNS